MPKLSSYLLTAAGFAAVSITNAAVLIDISLDDANTTATQAVINFALSGNIDAGTTPEAFAQNALFVDLTGSVLAGQIVDNQNVSATSSGEAFTSSGISINNGFETRVSTPSRIGINFTGSLDAGTTFSGIGTGTFATQSLIDVSDFDALDVYWSVGNNSGTIFSGPVVGATSVAPVPEASSFAAFAGLAALGFLATRRRMA